MKTFNKNAVEKTKRSSSTSSTESKDDVKASEKKSSSLLSSDHHSLSYKPASRRSRIRNNEGFGGIGTTSGNISKTFNMSSDPIPTTPGTGVAEIILRKYGLYKGSIDYTSFKSLGHYYYLKNTNQLLKK